MIRLTLILAIATVFAVSLSGCYTRSSVVLPDGTKVDLFDSKSREGFELSWTKTKDGYAVTIGSTGSGADRALAGAVYNATSLAARSIGAPIAPIAPAPAP